MKIRLVDVACKCEKTYCLKHRHPEEHACTFDYRASAKEVLLKYMSTPVVASKIEAI
jgi:predicted nucleic acid binding AN1-type Zn finger protein